MAKKSKVASETQTDAEAVAAAPEMSKVMYIGHLPHGFYEKQLRGFFSQFGQVTRLKLSRNKKTGKAKHYAFLEFRTPEVAQIAAEAMDGYMLFTQKLECHAVPASELHSEVFKGTNRRFKKIPWKRIETKRHDGERTEEQQEQRIQRAIKRDQKRQDRLKKAGIDYEYDALKQAKQEVAQKAEKTKKGKSKVKRKQTV